MHDSQNKRHTESKEEKRRKLCGPLSDTVTLYFLVWLAALNGLWIRLLAHLLTITYIPRCIHLYILHSYRAAQGVEEERAAFKYHNSIWLQFDNDV